MFTWFSNFRNCNLQSDDVDCLRHTLVHIPNLEQLDLSDNPIETSGIRFVEFNHPCIMANLLRSHKCVFLSGV